MKVHTFQSTHDAYDWSQVGEHPDTHETIGDGDVLVVPSEGVIGVLAGAWPIAVVFDEGESGSFHEYANIRRFAESIGRCHDKYDGSVKRAIEVAHQDADVTGNETWRQA